VKKDYILTFVTEFTILGSGLLVYRLAADILGKEGFSEYALVRRTISFLLPALLLGISVGLVRYVSISISLKNDKKAFEYFLGSLMIVVPIVLVFLFISYLFREFFSYLILGKEKGDLVFPLGLSVLGLCLHTILYSYLRGKLKMFQANLLQLFNLGILNLLPFLLPSVNIKEIFLYWGLGTVCLSFIGIFFIFFSEYTSLSLENLMAVNIELFKFGVGRVPTHLGLPLFLLLLGVFIVHLVGIKEGGYVSFSVSMLNLAASFFSPIGLVFFPQINRLIGKGEYRLFKNYVLKLYKYCLTFGILILLGVEFFGDKLIILYLGTNFSEVPSILRFTFIGYIPFLLYTLSVNPLDAISIKPIYTKYFLRSLLVFTTLTFVGWKFLIKEPYFILACFVLSLWLLGFFCTYRLIREVGVYER